MSTEAKLTFVENRIAVLSDRLETLTDRLDRAIERLGSRVDDLEYSELSNVKNNIYSLETKLSGVERCISSLERNSRY